MEHGYHSFSELFRQLGLPDGQTDIERFIAMHSPLPKGVALADAPFWDRSQSSFLKEELAEDADWAELIDMLDARLRRPISRTVH
ncbi:MAG TPA: DUF2789 domain-containing protein [Aquabacterium sp.]|nr:DUF2789 domain-containing protein [Aquabacterium sp.]